MHSRFLETRPQHGHMILTKLIPLQVLLHYCLLLFPNAHLMCHAIQMWTAAIPLRHEKSLRDYHDAGSKIY